MKLGIFSLALTLLPTNEARLFPEHHFEQVQKEAGMPEADTGPNSENAAPNSLLALLASLDPIEEEFPEINDPPPAPE